LQSTIIYAIILLFPIPQKPPSKMFDLQILASLKQIGLGLRRGKMILPEELSHQRPSWKSWVLVNCKRRALSVLSCLEWMNAMLNNFTNFPCDEDHHAPSTCSKTLWNIDNEESWKAAYDRFLGRWAGLEIYTVGDLRGTKPGPTLDQRSEMWLGEADELGMLFMTLGENAKIPLSGTQMANSCASQLNAIHYGRYKDWSIEILCLGNITEASRKIFISSELPMPCPSRLVARSKGSDAGQLELSRKLGVHTKPYIYFRMLHQISLGSFDRVVIFAAG
jgi:hypothetical protein